MTSYAYDIKFYRYHYIDQIIIGKTLKYKQFKAIMNEQQNFTNSFNYLREIIIEKVKKRQKFHHEK